MRAPANWPGVSPIAAMIWCLSSPAAWRVRISAMRSAVQGLGKVLLPQSAPQSAAGEHRCRADPEAWILQALEMRPAGTGIRSVIIAADVPAQHGAHLDDLGLLGMAVPDEVFLDGLGRSLVGRHAPFRGQAFDRCDVAVEQPWRGRALGPLHRL